MSAPIVAPIRRVEAGWIDYNGHLNMAYYNVLFDKAVDFVYDTLGIGASYVTERNGSVFTMEVHVSYLNELSLDDPTRVEFQLLDWDAKRLHFFETMYQADTDEVAATSEQLALHVDMHTRRSAPFPEDVQVRVRQLMKEHGALPKPERAGRSIGIPRGNR